MKYVGIPNSEYKTKLVKEWKKGEIKTVTLPCLTGPDSSRHLEVLDMFRDKKLDWPSLRKTQYYRFQWDNGFRRYKMAPRLIRDRIAHKIEKRITAKLRAFRKMYKNIRKHGYDYKKGYVIVSTQGARLDGSHRSSIVEHLGMTELDIVMIDWTKILSKNHARSMQKQLNRQKKYYKMEDKI